MIDAFEARAADLLADRLSTTAQVRLWVGAARPWLEVGDDREQVRRGPGGFELRPVLRLAGELFIELEIGAPGEGGPGAAVQRQTLIGALDQLLVALNDGAVRDGTAFATDVDQGFELDGFRLDRVEQAPDALSDFRRIRAVYAYAGRFWPVQPALAGPAIETLPTRIVVLPAKRPEVLAAVAGGPDLEIPIALDLRVRSTAIARVVARLLGASPPGALIGDPTGLPPGSVGYVPDDGRFQLVYRPPVSLSKSTRVSVELSLSRQGGKGTRLDTLHIEVSA
jgi:hypothetical protein